MTTSWKILRSLYEECTNLCEERMHIWTKLDEDPEMKVIEARLRDAQEKA
jgi:hypothetical protein